MKKLILPLLFSFSITMAGDVGGSFSTGVFMGTPFWNSENTQDGKTIEYDDSFLRSVNQLRFYGDNFGGFSFRLNAIRSDGFQSENRLTNTKIYEIFGQYNFSMGHIQAGRIMPFNRWIMTSIDGGALSLNVNKKIRVTAMGGMSVQYGKVWDDENSQALAYADVAYQGTGYRVKLKYFHDDDMDKAGADFYGGFKKLRVNGNYGFDITNSRLADGGLNLSYAIKRNILISGNYLLYRAQKLYLTKVEFNPYMIERFMLGARYLGGGYHVDFKQLAAMNSERSDYMTFLTFTQKFFTVGANYLTGDSKMKRIGFTLGFNYSATKDLKISAGVSPVDHMFYDTSDHQFTTAVYLRAKFRFLEKFQAMANLNFYDSNKALHATTRGGLRLQYNFGS